MPKWECPKCGEYNDNENRECAECGSQKPTHHRKSTDRDRDRDDDDDDQVDRR